MICSQDILRYTQLFRNEDAVNPNAHPGALAVEVLAGPVEADRVMHCKQLAAWYDEYARRRNGEASFQELSDAVSHLEHSSRRSVHRLLNLSRVWVAWFSAGAWPRQDEHPDSSSHHCAQAMVSATSC